MDSDDLGFLDIDQIFADQILSDDFLTEYSGGASSPSSGSDSAFSNGSLGSQFVQNIQAPAQRPLSNPVQPRPPIRRSAPPYSVKQVPVTVNKQNNGIEELPMKKTRTPVREQRIHATESVQIIKVEPDCEIVGEKSPQTRLPMVTQANSNVLFKVEPTEFVTKPVVAPVPQIKIPDIL